MSPMFTAQFAFAEDDGKIITSGLADRQFDASHYVTFQKTIKASEQDGRLGLDGIYLEVNDQIHSSYGGVESIELFETRLEVYLTEKAANSMKLPTKFSVGFKQDLPSLTSLIEMLMKMQIPIRKVVTSFS